MSRPRFERFLRNLAHWCTYHNLPWYWYCFRGKVRLGGKGRFWCAACKSVSRTCSTSTLFIYFSLIYTAFIPAPLAMRPEVGHFLTGNNDVSMCQWDCVWLPISPCEISRQRTRPQTPTLSCIIFTCHSSYPTFYNWWSRLRRHSHLCLEQASPRNQICHITTCFQMSTAKLIFSIAFKLTLVKWLKFFSLKTLSL